MGHILHILSTKFNPIKSLWKQCVAYSLNNRKLLSITNRTNVILKMFYMFQELLVDYSRLTNHRIEQYSALKCKLIKNEKWKVLATEKLQSNQLWLLNLRVKKLKRLAH